MSLLNLPDELLVASIPDHQTFVSMKSVDRAHYERLSAIENIFYAKLVNASYKEIYIKPHCFVVKFGIDDSYNLHLFFRRNSSELVETLFEWIDEDTDDMMDEDDEESSLEETEVVVLIDYVTGDIPYHYLGNMNEDASALMSDGTSVDIRGSINFVKSQLLEWAKSGMFSWEADEHLRN